MTVNDHPTSPKGERPQARSAAVDKATRNEKPSSRDREPKRGAERGKFSTLVHASPDTHVPPTPMPYIQLKGQN